MSCRRSERQYKSLEDVYPSGQYEVWYARKGWFDWETSVELGELVLPKTKNDLKKTHVLIGTLNIKNLEEIYYKMQGEVWSPEGEAYTFIKGLGTHTTMSTGDAVYNPSTKELSIVADIGFKTIKLT